MIGLVVVTHSAKASEGIVEIATEMGGDARIVPAGGDPDGGIGTDVDAIADSIREADDGDGVVLLVGIGSAVMSVDVAVEMVGDEVDVQVADAPILEGALNAAVEASSEKATLESVVERAEEARDYRKL